MKKELLLSFPGIVGPSTGPSITVYQSGKCQVLVMCGTSTCTIDTTVFFYPYPVGITSSTPIGIIQRSMT
jgi:hypothetical protein